MSMIDEFETIYPGENVLEEPFIRFIRWLEDNGQSWRYDNGVVVVTPYLIDSLTDLWSQFVILPEFEYPDSWFGNDTLRHNIVALASADGTGSVFALWRPNGDEHHYVFLGSEGERMYLTADIVKFLQLLTFGIDEFSANWFADDPDLEAARPSRDWIMAEFDVTYPATVKELIDPSRQSDFEAWVEASIG